MINSNWRTSSVAALGLARYGVPSKASSSPLILIPSRASIRCQKYRQKNLRSDREVCERDKSVSCLERRISGFKSEGFGWEWVQMDYFEVYFISQGSEAMGVNSMSVSGGWCHEHVQWRDRVASEEPCMWRWKNNSRSADILQIPLNPSLRVFLSTAYCSSRFCRVFFCARRR